MNSNLGNFVFSLQCTMQSKMDARQFRTSHDTARENIAIYKCLCQDRDFDRKVQTPSLGRTRISPVILWLELPLIATELFSSLIT